MSSVNKVILVGHLGADPELRYTQSGRAVCKLSLATNRRWRDAEGNQQEQTDWHKVTTWGKQAEVCRDHLKKGRQVYVEGRLYHSSYEDKTTGQKRYSTEVVSHSVVFLAGGNRGAYDGGTSAQVDPRFESHQGPPARDAQTQCDDSRPRYGPASGSSVAAEPAPPAPPIHETSPSVMQDDMPF